MKISYDSVIEALQHPNRTVRIQAANAIGELITKGKLTRTVSGEVNNHIHTTYSFSPYEPAMAAYKAWQAGLTIVGSIDHDSVSAAEEMKAAAAGIGIASTVGFEVRTSFLDTPLADRKINNPDAPGIAYMVVHGVPSQAIEKCREFLKPINKVRNERSAREVDAMNELLAGKGISPISFEDHVKPLSHADENGSITERHILSALAGTIMEEIGTGEALISYLQEILGVKLSGRILEYLADRDNPHYRYDLLGVLKANFLPKFYISPDPEEILPARDVVQFARSIHAIPAYSYLGDVKESPTGDKKAEQFEDSYLDELFDVLVNDLKYPAITYMPPRNTKEQLKRLQKLAEHHGLMQISGVDINSSRQKFNCPELLEPEYAHLISSAWALVAHEKLASYKPELSIFHPENPLAGRTLNERLEVYADLGKRMDPKEPESIWALAQKELNI